MLENKVRTIEVEVEYEENVGTFKFEKSEKTYISSLHDSPKQVNNISTYLKKIVKKNPNRLVITITGVGDGYSKVGIKRYTFDMWDGTFDIEHRPFKEDYSIDVTVRYDSLPEMVGAFGEDVKQVILDSIQEFGKE